MWRIIFITAIGLIFSCTTAAPPPPAYQTEVVAEMRPCLSNPIHRLHGKRDAARLSANVASQKGL